MKLTISDISFHNKIMSGYRKEKRYRLMFPSMFFLRSVRKYLSRIIDMHVRLNLHIHHKYMSLSSVLLQKFHDMKLIFSSFRAEKQILREVSHRLKETSTISKTCKIISGFHEINKILANGTKTIFNTPIFRIENYNSKKLVSFRKENDIYRNNIFYPLRIITARQTPDYPITENNSIITPGAANSQKLIYLPTQRFNYPLTTAVNYFVQSNRVNQESNYLQTVNNIILSRTLNRNKHNYQTAVNKFFPPDAVFNNLVLNYPQSIKDININSKVLNYRKSNYLQTVNNIFSQPGIINGANRVNHWVTENTLDGGNNFTLRIIEKQCNTSFKERTNFRKMETNRHILKLNMRAIAHPNHTEDIHTRRAFTARVNSLDFADPLKSERQNVIYGLNNNTTGTDIVFKKPYSENKITGENKLNNEKTISAKIRTDKQIKNVSSQGDIISIANKVYKLLERRLSIEKEKRGAHIIG